MKVVDKKNLLPFFLVATLFLLWGLANNMTDTLLAAFRKVMAMSDTETSFIQLAFYGAYFVIALPAAIFIRKRSFKAGVILGLCLYACGAILFLPAAKAASYAFYLIAIYILASGCSVLETTANPYILSMGSPETATRRLNFAQSFNPIGLILGIILSNQFILKDVSLYSISGTYAVVGFVLLAIMLIMLFANMPQDNDDAEGNNVHSILNRLLDDKKYLNGVVAQFLYVGAQTGVWSFTVRVTMQELGCLEEQAATVYLIAIIGFCFSRFLYSWLMKYFAPVKLLVFGSATALASSLAVALLAGTGWVLVVFLILISFFMSLMFPTIFGIALEPFKSPEDVKIGASGLIMAILGGALVTPLQGMFADTFGINVSYIVPGFCFAAVLAYAITSLPKKSK